MNRNLVGSIYGRSSIKIAQVAMFVIGSGRNEQSLQRIFHRCFLPSFGTFRQEALDFIAQNDTSLVQADLDWAKANDCFKQKWMG
jgi:hypothetical protein